MLSTDGGATFPTTLAANTLNDGSQLVTLPSTATTQARVKVEAVGNIFFDVSDANFTISSGNAAPVAADDVASTPVDTAVQIDVLANDSDADGTLDATSVAIVAAAQHGSTSVHPVTGVVTDTPAPGYQGLDAFDYTVEDDDGAVSAPATVSLTVGAASVTLVPSSFTLQAGMVTGGTVASLAADDDSFLVVTSSKTTPRPQRGTGRSPAWTTRSVPSPRRSEGRRRRRARRRSRSGGGPTPPGSTSTPVRWGRPNRRSRTSARPVRSPTS